MFNLFKSTFGDRRMVGVDIGTTSIKMVELSGKRGEKPSLENYGTLEGVGYLDRANNAIQTSTLKMMDKEVVDLLQLLLKKLNIKSRDVIASLPTFSAFTTLLDIPMMSTEETAQAVEYQARAFVPLPISEVAFEWNKITEYEDERGVKKQQIFLIAVPNSQIQKYRGIFKAAGLNLKALEIEGVSLSRVATTGDAVNTLIVDIGGRSTTLAVSSKGLLKSSTQIDYGGGSLTQAIAGGLNINSKRAEELKKQRGLMGTGGEYELSTLMAPFIDVIIAEAKRAKYGFEKDNGTRVERIILSGGGANLKGIENYVNREFQLPTIKIDPMAKINYPEKLLPLRGEIGPPFAVAFGLAIKEFAE